MINKTRKKGNMYTFQGKGEVAAGAWGGKAPDVSTHPNNYIEGNE